MKLGLPAPLRGCQGIPLPKKPARGLPGSRPAARCSAAHQACGWGGAGPFLSQRRGSSPRPRGPSRSARPRGWPAAWRGPGPDAHVPAAGALPASRAQPSEPSPWLLRAPPSACSDGAGRDQHRWAPLRARPWANCVLSGLFPGLRGDGGRFLGGPATSWTQRSHVHGAHSRWKTRVRTRSGGLPRGRKDSPPRGRTSTLCLVISSGAALSFWILVLKQDLWREPGQVQCPLQG